MTSDIPKDDEDPSSLFLEAVKDARPIQSKRILHPQKNQNLSLNSLFETSDKL